MPSAFSLLAQFKWLFIIFFIHFLIACSGSLGPGATETPVEGGVDTALPASPQVNDANILLTQEAIITGTCLKNQNRSNQTDIIEVDISGSIQTAACNGSGLGTWTVAYPTNSFTKGQYTISVIARNNSGSQSTPGYGNLTVRESGDEGGPIVGPEIRPVSPTFNINPIEFLETQNIVIAGGCNKNNGADTQTDFINIGIEGNGQTVNKTTACKVDASGDTWRVDMGQLTEGVYVVSATALNNAGTQSETTKANLYVESAIITMLVDLEKNEIESGENTLLTITFQDQIGNIVSGTVSNLRFSSSCIQKNNANMLNQNGEEVDSFSSENGSVLAVYESDGCNGVDEINITGAFNGNAVSNDQPVLISTQPDQVAQIRWLSSTPDSIVTQGSNGEQIAEIVYELIGTRGAKVPNQEVTFEIKTTDPEQVADLTLLNTTSLSDNQGQVSVRVRSGFKPINVTLSALYTNPETGEVVEGQSFDLSVTSGLTSYGNFSLDLKRHSPLSFDRSSATVDKVEVIATVNDRFGDSVTDGTRVTFKVESTTRSGNEGAIGSFFDTNGEIKDAFCKTVDGVCSIFWAPNKNDVIDGWVTIMAVAKGQENFIDANSNNVFDDGDSFFDTAEPFLDQRAYWREDDAEQGGELIQYSDYVEGEYFLVDTNDDGERNLPNNKFDGVNCQHSTECSGRGYIDVAAQTVFNQASADNIVICRPFDIQNLAVVDANQQITLNNLSFCDEFTRQTLPTGTTFNIITSDGASVSAGGSNFILGQNKFPQSIGVTIKADEEIKTVSLTAELVVPKANTTDSSDVTYFFNLGIIDIRFPIFVPNFPERPSLSLQSFIKKGEIITASGSCSETTTYPDLVTGGEAIDIPSANLDFYIDARLSVTSNCSAGSYSQGFSFSTPGLKTLSLVSRTEPNPNLVESTRAYISEPQVRLVYVTNTPSNLTDISLNGNQLVSYATQADANGAIALTGRCDNTDTTHALLSFTGINAVNKVDANQNFNTVAGQPTITTTGFFKTIDGNSYAAAYCNQGEWMLRLTGFGANSAVNGLQLFSLNEKERIYLETNYPSADIDYSRSQITF